MTALGLASIASVVDLVPSLVLRHRPRQPTFWGETPLGQARSTGCLLLACVAVAGRAIEKNARTREADQECLQLLAFCFYKLWS